MEVNLLLECWGTAHNTEAGRGHFLEMTLVVAAS